MYMSGAWIMRPNDGAVAYMATHNTPAATHALVPKPAARAERGAADFVWMWLFKQWHTFFSASKWIQMRMQMMDCAAVHVYIVGAQTDSRLLFMQKPSRAI